MIDVIAAEKLLDFNVKIGDEQRAMQQLEGAVAVHNLLESQRVAYLADEVGMGKTYVALGALALFRHYQPDFRVLIIAPRENIQNKWMKELRNFVKFNIRYPDLRVKALDGRPARSLVACGNLLNLIHETTIDRNRDFFTRLTSFSLPVLGREAVDSKSGEHLRSGLREYLPWMRDEIFDLRNKEIFKDNFAKALCCALPEFDLVIVDEAHNLKHGFGKGVSSRNRVLGLAMGQSDSPVDSKLFPGYGSRAKRVLFLSATPVEESYRHLWNQLHVFGRSDEYDGLISDETDEPQKQLIARKFLIRRVTSIRVGDTEHTKNLYRREWRRGGVHNHDEPILVNDARQRLIVALVQKKVSELLGHARFNSSFQIGMLASFESFLETTKLKRDETEIANFDDADQTEDATEREGIDVMEVNRLARSYRKKFYCEMPHPKMDALRDSLSKAWVRGDKSLVFVRRVASVKELKRKLDERYNAWLMDRLVRELPPVVHVRLKSLFKQYELEKMNADGRGEQMGQNQTGPQKEEQDRGGYDTFFAWYFRGEGPSGVISGANIQQRFVQRGAVYATFFEDNYAADILGCRPGEVEPRLAAALGVTIEELRTGLQERSRRFLSLAKRHARADRYEAVQASAIEWLKDYSGPLQESARLVWHQRFESSIQRDHARQAPQIDDWLELPTFFTELRMRPELRQSLWPEQIIEDPIQRFRNRELRAQLLASTARLGHSFIDLYVLTIKRLGSLELRAQESSDEEGVSRDSNRIDDYLNVLESQMRTPLEERGWCAFDELTQIAIHFDLILDVNEPEVRDKPLSETVRVFGQLLRQQQPVAGMSGQINQTLVRQFRMPGYPLVLVTTDLLQEGEDLHTFCSSVHHYGISWTPSSMEQRIGRIDRVRSHTDRRLVKLKTTSLNGEDKLQVFFPYLEDTVEVLQVQRVLERMNVFMRLMHEGLIAPKGEQRSINANYEYAKARRVVPQILDRLQSAFPVRPEHLVGSTSTLAVPPQLSIDVGKRFDNLSCGQAWGVDVTWEPQHGPGILLGTAKVKSRVQPFTLILRSIGSHPVVRCISPVGCIAPRDAQYSIIASTGAYAFKLGAIEGRQERTYDLTVEGDVLLGDSPTTDLAKVGMLVQRITSQADFLEQQHLPGSDEILPTFRKDMVEEGSRD